MEQEAYGIYYAVTKSDYYLQGSDNVVCNDQIPLQKFLHGKNGNNKVNRWSLEPITHNITFEWISGTQNKAPYYLSWLVNVKDTPATPVALINMLVTTTSDGSATCTCSKTCNTDNTTLLTDPTTTSPNDKVNAPLPLTEDWKDTL